MFNKTNFNQILSLLNLISQRTLQTQHSSCQMPYHSLKILMSYHRNQSISPSLTSLLLLISINIQSKKGIYPRTKPTTTAK